MQLLDILLAPWAIDPAKLREMRAIYVKHMHGEQIDLAAIEARLGRPLANEQQEYRIEEGGVAVLPIEGVMAPKANLFMRVSGGASTQMLQKQIESAMVDPRVRSMILAIDSPGGSVFGTPELAASVYELSKVKPIVAVSDARIMSAAYWAGSAASAIYISGPTVEVGSVGVVGTHSFNPREAEGITEITAGKYKRIATGNAPLSAEGREYLQGQVDHVYTVFVDAVANHRATDVDTVLEHMADGRVFIGQQAIDAGLVDGFSTVDAMVEKLASDPEAFAKRRKAKVMVAVSSPAPGPAPLPSVPPTLESQSMKTRAELAAANPELLQSILAEGEATGFAKGAAAERDRIKSVEGASIPGHEALVQTLKFDGKTSGGDAALAVNAAERTVREAQGKANANAAPGVVVLAPSPAVIPSEAEKKAAADAELEKLPLEARCKAQWEKDASLQGEFQSLEAFTAYSKAMASGKARVLAKT